MKADKPKKLWEVYVPVAHHEIYVDVPGETALEAIANWKANSNGGFHCVGEVQLSHDRYAAKQQT